MAKRIFKNTMLIIFIVAILCGTFILGVVYDYFTEEISGELKNEATYISQGVELQGEEYLTGLEKTATRITWVAADGTVIYDNVIDITTMDNHKDRDEIKEAMTSSKGDSIRHSSTLSEETIYYAVRIDDGSVIRVSYTQSSVLRIVLGMIPPIVVILIIALSISGILAYRLTKQIIAPLDQIDLDHPEDAEVYDEMFPFVSKIVKQNKQIKATMEELSSQQQEFRMITENMQEGFIVIDKNARILSYNSSALKLFGVNCEVENRNVLVLNRTSEFDKAVQTSLQGRHSESILLLGERYCNVYVNPVFNGKEIAGSIIIVTDVTEKEERENLRREFSANVSHELKTPLTSISGIAEIMKNGIVDQQDIPRFAGNIYDEAKRLISLIEDIIKVSQMDEMDGIPEKEAIGLHRVAEEVVAHLKPIADKNNITFELNVEACSIIGVKTVIQEMIQNICDNAIKYNVEGGKVIVETGINQSAAYISVTDTGIGIPEELKERVFERFYRVDKSHSKEIGGTGLGLSIVKHGAKLHNATIDVRSKVSEGTCITITFPL